jgi:hypothetical protein
MVAVYVDCPHCGDEIEVEMRYEASEWDTNYAGGYFADGPLIRYCACVLTQIEEAELCDAAEVKANDPDYFGSEDG